MADEADGSVVLAEQYITLFSSGSFGRVVDCLFREGNDDGLSPYVSHSPLLQILYQILSKH